MGNDRQNAKKFPCGAKFFAAEIFFFRPRNLKIEKLVLVSVNLPINTTIDTLTEPSYKRLHHTFIRGFELLKLDFTVVG